MLIAQKQLKLRISNLTQVFPGTVRTWPPKIFPKGGVATVTWPINFWALNANSSKTVKATDFNFDVFPGSRDSPDMILQKFSQKGAWPRSRDPLIFWALNAISSKTVKSTYFKFDVRVPRHSPDMTPKNFPKSGRGHGHVTP